MEGRKSKKWGLRNGKGTVQEGGRKSDFEIQKESFHDHQEANYHNEFLNSSRIMSGISPICLASEVPDVEGADVVLNRRGTPVRARKRSRLLSCDDFEMSTFPSQERNDYNKYSTAASPRAEGLSKQLQKDIKQEPMEHQSILRSQLIDATEFVSSGRSVTSKCHLTSVPKLMKLKDVSNPPRACPRPKARGARIEEEFSQNNYCQERLSGVIVSTDTPPTKNANAKDSGAIRAQIKTRHSIPAESDIKSESSDPGRKINDRNVSSKSQCQLEPIGASLENRISKKSKNSCGVSVSQSVSRSQFNSPLPSMPDLSMLLNSDSEIKYEVPSLPLRTLPKHQVGTLTQQSTKSTNGNHPRLGVNGSQWQQPYLGQVQVPAISSQVLPAVSDKTKARLEAEGIWLKLRNVLKLPKAHKWVYFEWFYSDLDRALFEKENDFEVCLRTGFPPLKTRMLNKMEWSQVRRMMGKPRRCSSNFFDQEREDLARRRLKIRMIQQRVRLPEDWVYNDLPDQIPLQIMVGSKVTARVRRPQDGIFTGTVEGLDPSNNTYRINFTRPDIGAQSIVDYEVMSEVAPDSISVSSFTMKFTQKGTPVVSQFNVNNPVLLENHLPEGLTSALPANGMLGGFPVRLLELIVRLTKYLKMKREKIWNLRELNVAVEKMKTYRKQVSKEFLVLYSCCVRDIDAINEMVRKLQKVIRLYLQEIPADSMTKIVDPLELKSTSLKEASLVVSMSNYNQGIPEESSEPIVQNPKIVSLIEVLTSVLLQLRELASGQRKPYELESLQSTMRGMKSSLLGSNVRHFENLVEVPMSRLMAGLCISRGGKSA